MSSWLKPQKIDSADAQTAIVEAWPNLHPRVLSEVKKLFDDVQIFAHEEPRPNTADAITIVCIVHDRSELYFEACLNSILEQSDNRYKLLVINNGCIPQISIALEQQFQAGHIDVLIWSDKHLYDPSAGDANPVINLWNLGALLGSGKFFFYINPDDFLSTNYVAEMLRLLQSESCVAAAPLVVPILEDGTTSPHADVVRAGNQQQTFTPGNVVAMEVVKTVGQKMFTRPGGLLCVDAELLMRNGGLDCLSDHTLFFKVGIFGCIGYSPEAHMYWRYHPNQANTLQAGQGFVYFDEYANYPERHRIRDLLLAAEEPELADQIEVLFWQLGIEKSTMAVYHAFQAGFGVGLRAVLRLLGEAPAKVAACILLGHLRGRFVTITRRIRKGIRKGLRKLFRLYSALVIGLFRG